MKMSLLFRVIVISALSTLTLCLEEQKEIPVPRGREITIQNLDYPHTSPDPKTSLIWKLVSPPGTLIKIECPDVRISPSKNCENGFMRISYEGSESEPYCGSISGLKAESTDNVMTLHFELVWAAGVFQCKVQTEEVHKTIVNEQLNKDGETIHLKVGEVLYHQIQMKQLQSINKKYNWKFSTEPGYKIGIRCPYLWFANRYTPLPACDEGFALFDLGNRKVEICNGSNDLTLVSSGERMEVTVETNPKTYGGIHCVVLATTGPHFEEYKNQAELPDEDSNEYGYLKKTGPKRTTCECGWANKPPSRIIHGDYVSPHEFPFMAGLLKSADALDTFCGGTIVTKRHVISAAHCTLKTVATHVLVGMDHVSKREGGKIYPVLETINHDHKNGYASSKDISILIMAEEIEFSISVGPACMPTKDPNIINQPVVAMGWGAISVDEIGRDHYQLKKAKLRVISMESCNPVWDGRWPVYPQTHICTWHKNKDVCFGDSGGPVVWLDPETNRYTLVGIPSVCDGCKLQKPALHTALHHYYPWIKLVISSNRHGEHEMCTKID
uniref:Venom S1 protease with CUB domain 3 n=1 Tax=Oncocephalus sp. TaxID=2944721 RepID=A0AB38ZEJ1_9HEMI